MKCPWPAEVWVRNFRQAGTCRRFGLNLLTYKGEYVIYKHFFTALLAVQKDGKGEIQVLQQKCC